MLDAIEKPTTISPIAISPYTAPYINEDPINPIDTIAINATIISKDSFFYHHF